MKSIYQSTIVIFVITVLILAGCEPSAKESKMLNEVVTKTNVTDLLKKLRDDKDFTSQDFEYFANGMTRLVTMSVDSLMGKTIKYVIKAQKDFERDQIAAQAANQATKVELVMNHEFQYIGISPRQIEDQNRTLKEVDFMVYEITNKSDKEIANVQGMLQFMDQNNQLVKVYPIMASKILKDDVVKPGETKRIAHPFDHDVANIRDERIRKEHANLRPIWICTMIEFKDGSKISVTNTL